MKGERTLSKNLMTNIGDFLGLAKDISIGELAPFVSNGIQSFKIRRLAKRLDTCEGKIDYLSQKVKIIDDDDFVIFLKEFLFPSILQSLLDEEEDKKTSLFLDGFETVIDNRIIEESKILILYDVMRELRFIEIQYLLSLWDEGRNENTQINPFAKGIKQDLLFLIQIKLTKYGLIRSPIQMNVEVVDDDIRLLDIGEDELTKAGMDFLTFYRLIEKE